MGVACSRGRRRAAAYQWPLATTGEQIEVTVLLLGLDGAGKSAVARSIVGAHDEEVGGADNDVTVGFAQPLFITSGGVRVRLLEVGGGARVRPLWTAYYGDAHALLWVLDASSKGAARLGEAALELQRSLAHPRALGKPLLVLAAGCVEADLPALAASLDLGASAGLARHSLRATHSSAGQPDARLQAALDWLIAAVGVNWTALDDRRTRDKAETAAGHAAIRRAAAGSARRVTLQQTPPLGFTGCDDSTVAKRATVAEWPPLCETCAAKPADAAAMEAEAESSAAPEASSTIMPAEEFCEALQCTSSQAKVDGSNDMLTLEMPPPAADTLFCDLSSSSFSKSPPAELSLRLAVQAAASPTSAAGDGSRGGCRGDEAEVAPPDSDDAVACYRRAHSTYRALNFCPHGPCRTSACGACSSANLSSPVVGVDKPCTTAVDIGGD